jgi:uncharacterized cupin superfamily protein
MLGHLDEVPAQAIDRGELRGTRRRVGAAVGARRAGLSRYRMGPGERAMPVHVHGDEEELFHVLSGDGLSWHDGSTYAVGAGDTIFHAAGGAPHTLVGAGDGLDVLAFSSGSDTGLTWLPRAGAMWAAPHWVPPDGPSPFDAEVAAGPLEVPAPSGERPASIVALEEVEALERREGDVAHTRRNLAEALGAQRCGMRHLVVEPGGLTFPPHCHSAEEELFVVLDGDGALLLGDEKHPVRAGSVVCRPAGTGVAHALRAGAGPLTVLAFGTHDPNDIAFFPRSGKVYLRGIDAVFRVERVDYWEGER